MRRIRVILHIGAARCGSTSLQYALREQSETLRSRGILYPNSLDRKNYASGPEHNHSRIFESDSEESFRELSEILSFAKKRDFHTIILSAEFSHGVPVPDFFIRWKEAFESQIQLSLVLYIRPQIEFIFSAYKQWGAKLGDNLDEFSERFDCKWSLMIRNWQKHVTRDNFHINTMCRLKNNDVIEDFFFIMGIETSIKSHLIENRSLPDQYIRFLASSSETCSGISDNRLIKILSEYSKVSTLRDVNMSWPLEDQKKYMESYDQENRTLAQEFFDSETLFTDIKYDKRPYQKELTTDDLLRMTSVIMISQEEKLRRLENQFSLLKKPMKLLSYLFYRCFNK